MSLFVFQPSEVSKLLI